MRGGRRHLSAASSALMHAQQVTRRMWRVRQEFRAWTGVPVHPRRTRARGGHEEAARRVQPCRLRQDQRSRCPEIARRGGWQRIRSGHAAPACTHASCAAAACTHASCALGWGDLRAQSPAEPLRSLYRMPPREDEEQVQGVCGVRGTWPPPPRLPRMQLRKPPVDPQP